MQITSWLPRQPLPFAAPSRPELLETPPREEPAVPVRARAAIDAPQARVPQAEAPASAARPAAPAPGEKRRSSTTSTMPQAWITLTASFSRSAGMPARFASARMVANDWR